MEAFGFYVCFSAPHTVYDNTFNTAISQALLPCLCQEPVGDFKLYFISGEDVCDRCKARPFRACTDQVSWPRQMNHLAYIMYNISVCECEASHVFV